MHSSDVCLDQLDVQEVWGVLLDAAIAAEHLLEIAGILETLHLPYVFVDTNPAEHENAYGVPARVEVISALLEELAYQQDTGTRH